MDVGKEYLRALQLSFKMKNEIEYSKKNSKFKKVETSLDKLFYKVIDSKNAKFDDMVVLAQAYLYISYVIINKERDLYNSEIHLIKCLELLNGEELNQKAILIVISALNELAKLAYVRKNVRKSKSFLNYALQQCVKYKNEKKGYVEPIYIPRILGIEHEENAHLLDKLHLHIVTYLQEMYCINQDNSIMRILHNSAESTWSTQMEINRESEFLNVLKSSFRSVNIINPIIELSDRKKKFIAVIEARMDKLFHDIIDLHDVKLDDMVILARAYLYMSTIYSTKIQKEDLQKCESHLTKCTMLLKEKELDSKSILIAIRAFNELAYIKLKLQEPEKSELFLYNARRLYLAFTKGSDEYPDVLDVAMILGIEYDENCKTLLDSANIINLACLKMLPNKKLLISEDLENNISKWIHVVEKVKWFKDIKIDMVRERYIEIFKTSYEIRNLVRNTYSLRENVDEKSTSENVVDGRIGAIMEKMNKLFLFACIYKKCSIDLNFNEDIILAHAYLYMYLTLSIKGGEISSRIECLMKCTKLLNERELDPKAILVAIDVSFHSAKMYMSINELDNAKANIEKAIQLYVKYTKEINYRTPINAAEIFDIKCELHSDDILHFLFIDILKIFTTILQTVNSDQIALYSIIVCMHKSLKEKLNFLELIENSNIHYVLFLQAITLTKYFILHKRFIEIKNHLAVAYYLWQKFFTKTRIEGKQRIYSDHIYQYCNVTIKQNLVLYGIYLLRVSREKLLQNKQNASEKDDRLCEASSSKVESPTTSEEQCRELLFTDIEKYTKPFTNVIADKYILDYKDAEKVFVIILQYLYALKIDCNPKEDSVLYEHIILNTGHTYKYFANYEPDEDKRIKRIKRYIEIFENVINTTSLNTEYNSTRAKYILIDLGIAYSIILDIKTNSLQITSEVSEERSMDIVRLVKSSMQNFQLFLDSLKDGT